MKIIDLNNKNVNIFTGDIHGDFKNFVHIICDINKFRDCNIFVLGDIGVGFYKDNYYINLFNDINKKLKRNNIILIFIRGNHDDPTFFTCDKFNKSNIIFVDDYDIIKTYRYNVLCVGGAISIDRKDRWSFDRKTQRIIPDGYWQNEAVQDIPNNFIEFIKDINIDIVCSHCAPNFIENDYKNIPQKYIDNDINLLNDIKTNQQILDNLFMKYLKNKISKWYYGHYHRDRFCVCDDIDFICIDRLKNNKISYRFNYEEIYK